MKDAVLTFRLMVVSTLTGLAMHIPIEDLLIPPSAYMADRRRLAHIDAPYARGKRAFDVKQPLSLSSSGSVRLPRVLREGTSFVLMDPLIKTEGIFRMSTRAMTVDILKEAYDRGQKFIVWKEGDAVLTHSHHREGFGDVWVDELDQTEGWELHTAAGLIKQWYKELRDPIFPESCYMGLEKFYRSPDHPLEPSQLLAILSPDTEWSPISPTSRTILIMHLLPLLSRINDFAEYNRMTPQNLAVCFAPTLLRSADPIQDVKISAIIQRILEAMIVHWKNHLGIQFDMSVWKFEELLRTPEALADREDPLEETPNPRSSQETQVTGITLVNNHSSDDDDISSDNDSSEPPPLPPRPLIPTSPDGPGQSEPSSYFKRKPAPQVHPLPRYSMVIAERPAPMQGFYNTVPTEEDVNREQQQFWNSVPTEEDANPEPLPRASLEMLPEYQALDTSSAQGSPFPHTRQSPMRTNTVPAEEDVFGDEQAGSISDYAPRSSSLASPVTGVVRKPLRKAEEKDGMGRS